MTRRSIVLGAVLILAAVAGCGGGQKPLSPEQERQQIAHILHSYLHAQVSGDGQSACALLTSTAQSELTGIVLKYGRGVIKARPSCQYAVKLVQAVAGQKLLQALSAARIERIQVEGDRATARILDSGAFPPQQVSLQRSGNTWKIAGVPGLGG
jgi:hypothetical protein